MLFVDGENFVMRYAEMRKDRFKQTGQEPAPGKAVWFEPDKALWAQDLNPPPGGYVRMVRRYFYTSSIGRSPSSR
jgi:hypothetical protein